MRHDPLPPYQTGASLPDLPFVAIDALIRTEAAGQGLDLHDGHGRSTCCKLPGGDEFGARKGPTGSIPYVRAHARDRLQDLDLLDAVTGRLAEHLPGQRIAWSSFDRPGVHPPYFSLVRVASVTPVSADFLHLRLEGGDRPALPAT